jgi:hypothetical protein
MSCVSEHGEMRLISQAFQGRGGSGAASRTRSTDSSTALILADVLAEKRPGEPKGLATYFTETRFTKTGIDRRTISDFGLIGSIIAQFDDD